MKRTPLTAMLTLVAVIATTVAMAGCGGKATSGSHPETTNVGPTSTTSTTTTGKRKLPSKAPSY
jgi:ABC-type glycerol-3-phosphate transport system substrate-binding protein